MAHSRLSKTINAFVAVLCVPGCALAYYFDATLLWQGLAGVILVAIASPNLITNVAVQALGTIGFTIRLKDKAAGDGAQPSSASTLSRAWELSQRIVERANTKATNASPAPGEPPSMVLAQMKTRPHDEETQVACLRRIVELTGSSNVDADRQKIVRLDGVPLLLAALTNHAGNDPIAVRALTALKHLAALPETRAAFEDAGGLAAAPVIRVMSGSLARDQSRAEVGEAATSKEPPRDAEVGSRRCAEMQRLGCLVLGAACEGGSGDTKTAAVDEGLVSPPSCCYSSAARMTISPSVRRSHTKGSSIPGRG